MEHTILIPITIFASYIVNDESTHDFTTIGAGFLSTRNFSSTISTFHNIYSFNLIIRSILTRPSRYRQNWKSWFISPAMKIPSRHTAPMALFSGDRSKLMPNVVQNHQADNSLILPICSF